jgi:tRNA(fMet)-specific endonuclease VapC
VTYLVDSDWLVDAMVGVQSALTALQRHAIDGLAVSIISVGELFEGAFASTHPQRDLANLRSFLAPFPVIPLSEPIMELFAQHRHRLRRRGALIPDLDLLIAATALDQGLTLMTRNVRHFSRIPMLQLYGSGP